MRAWRDEKVTAVHEASHAVVAVHLKIKLNYLVICADEDDGFLNFGPYGFVQIKESRRQAEHIIIVCAAGAEAERYFFKRSSGGDRSDRRLIDELAEGAKIPN
jgi:ATP-dependent Zn protease